jgi:hypothetical protein
MCSRFSHISHILYFSVIDESHSLMWCFMTHFSHTSTIEQCFFMCSYFWQLKHCRKVQFLINRLHFLISKIFMKFSKSIRLIFLRWLSSYVTWNNVFCLVWLETIMTSSWWLNSNEDSRWRFANIWWHRTDYSYQYVRFLLRWFASRKFECVSWLIRLFVVWFSISFSKNSWSSRTSFVFSNRHCSIEIFFVFFLFVIYS